MTLAADRDRALMFLDRFIAAGAKRVEPPMLLEAGPLLDLYGEDIRARAFTTTDPLRGEAMLRPDFTVPVAQAHMAGGAAPARYAYAGEVFRRQEDDGDRAREYVQAGFEIMGGKDAADDDAQVFALIADTLAPWGARAATGDLGLLIAAIDALNLTETRRAALRRHMPRPRRFRSLLERFRRAGDDRPAAEDWHGPLVGKRTGAEIAARLATLSDEAGAAPLPPAQADALDALLDLSASMADAPGRLRDIEVDLPGIAEAVDRMEARARALCDKGINPSALPFSVTAGRGAMEYYDGFTFAFTLGAETVATGGRYDSLTRALGDGPGVAAVGGVIRPGLLGDAT